MEQPLVSIILTIYNQKEFLGATINSVLTQTYANIELIVIDNASSDGSGALIENFLYQGDRCSFILNQTNKGLCKSFNQGLALAKGKYIIDLSGDDILLPNRIETQVKDFESLTLDYIVVFSNATLIDRNGKPICDHYLTNNEGNALIKVPEGDVYAEVLASYFICTPTMMMRTELVRQLNGYDENLSFEDFDFWVRSAIKFKYHYTDKVLTLKRKLSNSLSFTVVEKGSTILDSCYLVCEKAYILCRNQKEFDLLANRIRTFIRKCWYAHEFELANNFKNLLLLIQKPGWKTDIIILFCRFQVPINGIYRFYIKKIKKSKPISKDL